MAKKNKLPDFFFGEMQNLAKSIESESERGTVILSSTMLEEALGVILKTKMHNKVEDKIMLDIFQGNGALSTFSSRIKMSYSLGLISRKEMKAIDVIRSIRNDFAHFRNPIPTLNEPTYKDRLMNISDVFPVEWDSDLRLRFGQICAAIAINITHMRVGMTKPCEEAIEFTSPAVEREGF